MIHSRLIRLTCLLCLCWGQLGSPSAMAQHLGEQDPQLLEWFEREVRPVFAEHCSSCHAADEDNRKGGLSLHSLEAMLEGGDSGPAIVPGKPDESLLVEAIRRESYEMPPEKPLPKHAREVLEKWVAVGAPWPDTPVGEEEGDWREQRFRSHWAWRPIESVAVPELDNDTWSRTAIDKFILAKLRENNLEPAGECDLPTLRRRLSFDLVGLPPAARSIFDNPLDAWESENALRQDVEELLSSPQFGVRWGRHWLDLVRYAETLGHEFDYPLHHAWRYRDTVIDSFNADIGYDRFVTEHLAGDQVEPRFHPRTGLNQSLALTGFWWLGDSVHAPVDAEGDWATRVDNQIDVVSKTFMGLTVACARCHDHKFDAIGTDDYYGLAGIAESTRRVYAITDPQNKIAEVSGKIEQQIQQAESTIEECYNAAGATGNYAPWLEQLVEKLAELEAAERDQKLPLESPAYYLRLLMHKQDSEQAKDFTAELLAVRRQVEQARISFDAWRDESELFADFGKGVLPSGWRAEGQTRSSGFDWFTHAVPVQHRGFLSSSLGLGQQVVLQSPNFELRHRVINIKGRAKSMQSVVSTNNYFMNEFHGLLFGDTRKPINQPVSRWYSHAGDLNKYLGAPTFLSFEDRSDGWFEIEEIRFADRRAPAEPHAVSLELAAQEVVQPQQLISLFSDQLKLKTEAAAGLWRECIRLSGELGVELPSALEPMKSLAEKARALDSKLPAPLVLLAARDNTPRNAAIAIRGNPKQRGDVVPRTCFVGLPAHTMPDSQSSGRLELARDLVDPRHPLASRVIVNRVWHHLMGRGLVPSTDNFGVLGGRPTHPELLDYLAREFVRHDWSLKWLIREITMSQVYRMSSVASAQQREVDPTARLWSHRPVRRLSAEAIRDSLLSVSNSLDYRLGGRSVAVHLTDQMTGRGRPRNSGPLDGGNRRSAYIEIRRNFLDPFLLAFDFPMPSTSTGKRTRSNVPAQALGMLNDPLVQEMTKRWVATTQAISDPRARVQRMIRTAYGRAASEAEVEDCVAFVEQVGNEGWQELAHVLLNGKEFIYLD